MVDKKKGELSIVDASMEKCRQLVSGGLEGCVVTVTRQPTKPGGDTVSYTGVFVRWANGYNTVHLLVPGMSPEDPQVPMPTIAPIDDAVVMRPNGKMEIEAVRSLQFHV